MFINSTEFSVYNGRGAVVIRWQQSGTPEGINSVNFDEPWTGTVDILAKRFTLDIAGHDPASKARSLTVHLEGSIDNIPPIADAGPKQQTFTCTARTGTPVTIDGTSSTDSDAGDSISHYQWFDQSATPLGNQPRAIVSLAVGETETIVLRVYDQQLSAALATVSVTVVDASPPCQ
jgi:hypothetical protein